MNIDDELSQTICETCSMQIISAFEFRQKAIKTDVMLKAQLENIKSESIELPQESHADNEEEEDGEDNDKNSEKFAHMLLQIKHENSDSMNVDCDPLNVINSSSDKSDDDETKFIVKSEPSSSNNITPDQENISDRNSESKSGTFICEVCSKKYTKENSYKQHKLRKHNIHTPRRSAFEGPQPEMPEILESDIGFSCPICLQFFKRRSNVSCHIKVVHFKIKRLKKYKQVRHNRVCNKLCQICGKHFTSFTTYHHHYKKHFPEKCLKCDTCGLLHTSKAELRRHELSHTDIKLFQCELCEYRTNYKGALNVSNLV